MKDKVMLYTIGIGEPAYGYNIGKAVLRNGEISYPEETFKAIRDNTLEDKCIFDEKVAFESMFHNCGLELAFEDKRRGFDQILKDIASENGSNIESYWDDTPFGRNVDYAGEFSNAMKNPPEYLMSVALGYDMNHPEIEIELTVGYIETEYADSSIARKFYLINENCNSWINRNIPYRLFIDEQRNRGRYFEMHLKDEPYDNILTGIKKYELRLYDEKRQNLKEGDVIRFSRLGSDNEDDSFYSIVRELKRYPSFSALYDAAYDEEDDITMYRCGASGRITKQAFVNEMQIYYTAEEQDRYGVVAIELELITSPETERRLKSSMQELKKRRPVTNTLDFSTWDQFSGTFFRALCFAEVAHRGAKRKKSDIDFICHPVEVASIIHDIVFRSKYPTIQILNRVVAAGALHDVVEDTKYSLNDIEEVFYESVRDYVADETENKRHDKKAEDTWRIRKEEFLEKLKNASDFSRTITLADKLSNLRDMYVDYKELGEELWNKFNNKNKDDHAWYYQSIVEELSKPNKEHDFIVNYELCKTEEYKELKQLVSEIFG